MAILAVVTLALNDHVFKAAFPGVVTGILSDVAGLCFFPLVLQAWWEVLGGRVGNRRALVVAVVATGVVFAAIQLDQRANDRWSAVLGWLQSPVRGRVVGTTGVADWPDLLALPTLGVPWVMGLRRSLVAQHRDPGAGPRSGPREGGRP